MPGLPERPDLDQLRRQARELLRAAASGDPRAADRLGAVAPHRTLAAAQLALAREYGFQSWTALKAEVARRRSSTVPMERWSFGGGAALPTPDGVLLPEILIAGADQAILHGSLTLTENGELMAPVSPRRALGPATLLARLVPRISRNTGPLRERRVRATQAMRAMHTGVTIVDDRGARYALRGGRGSGRAEGSVRLVHLRVEPAPGRDVAWIELRGHDGTTARLLPSPRVVARAGQPEPVRESPVAGPALPIPATQADGPRFHRDIGITLPPVEGITIRLDGLVSEPGGWLLYLCGTPRWRGPDPVTAVAEDDRGGTYLGSYARSTGVLTAGELSEERVLREDLALRFLPRLDPLARAIRLSFLGAHEEITVEIQW
jgi:hypothetical protein